MHPIFLCKQNKTKQRKCSQRKARPALPLRLRPLFSRSAFLAVLIAALLGLGGCAGTGTMYTPESDASGSGGTYGAPGNAAGETDGALAQDPGASPDAGTAGTSDAGDPDAEDAGEEDPEAGAAAYRMHKIRAQEAPAQAEEEEPRTRRDWLEGAGSDMYTVQTVDYYYGFTLDGVSLQLPCSTADLERAGWEILPAQTDDSGETRAMIPGYSYEFADIAPVGSSAAGEALPAGQASGRKNVLRLCLANFSDAPRLPADCTVCGVSAAEGSGVSLQTAFGTGLGDSLEGLTSVFGTDPSIYALTEYDDGVRSLTYRFSDGLTEDQRIPVLAEAAEKNLAEMLTAQTAQDGQTITSLSLYYFRLPE